MPAAGVLSGDKNAPKTVGRKKRTVELLPADEAASRIIDQRWRYIKTVSQR
jgi:hypothetical protein